MGGIVLPANKTSEAVQLSTAETSNGSDFAWATDDLNTAVHIAHVVSPGRHGPPARPNVYYGTHNHANAKPRIYQVEPVDSTEDLDISSAKWLTNHGGRTSSIENPQQYGSLKGFRVVGNVDIPKTLKQRVYLQPNKYYKQEHLGPQFDTAHLNCKTCRINAGLEELE